MALSTFIDIMEKKIEQNDLRSAFSFTEFTNVLSSLSPIKDLSKKRLLYESSDEEIFLCSKECILRNLINNPKLRDANFPVRVLVKLYDFMKNNTFTPDLLAQSLILLHSSKCNGNWQIFKEFFTSFDVKIINRNEFEYFDKLTNLFGRIKEIDFFKSIILECTEQLVSEIKFDYLKYELVFFECNMYSLRGFAGKNKIYLNFEQFVDIKTDSRFDWCTEEEKDIVFNLEFIRIMFHETVHVVLRANTKDLNSSSPFQGAKRSDQKIIESELIELGAVAETKVFGGLLNLIDSLEARKLDFSYCKKFIDEFLANKQVKFNIVQSKCDKYQESDLLRMALDYRQKRNKIFA